LAPIFVFFYLIYDRYRKGKLEAFASPYLLSKVGNLRERSTLWTERSFLIGAWIFATIAAAEPVGNPHYLFEKFFSKSGEEKEEEKTPSIPHEVVFLLDDSSSMLVTDTRKGTSRFDNAKEIVDSIASKIEGNVVSLYAFTSELIDIVPPTNDSLFFRWMSQNVSINEEGTSGTDFSHVFTMLQEKWDQDPKELIRTVILLSDGDDTSLEGLKASSLEKKEEEILSKLNFKNGQLKMFVIGLGSEKGGVVPDITYQGKPVISKMNASFLEYISKAGGGKFLIANQETPIGIALEVESFLQAREELSPFFQQLEYGNQRNLLIYEHYFQIPLLVAILFLILSQIKISWKRFAIFIIVNFSISPSAFASVPNAEFEEGKVFYEIKQYKNAEEHFKEALSESKSSWQTAVILYNLGTVTLRQGRWDEALDLFQKAKNIENLPPYLIAPLEINFSIALMQQLQSILDSNSAETALLSSSPLTNPISLLEITQKALQKAQTQFCVEKPELGIPSQCPSNPIIAQLEGILKNLKIQFLEKEKELNFQKVPYKEAIQQLSILIKNWIQQLSKAKKTAVNPDYYQQIYPFIKVLKNRVDELPSEGAKQFLEARKELREGVTSLQNQNTQEGIQHFEKANQTLEQLLTVLPTPSLVLVEIQKITDLLSSLLIHDQVTTSSISSLQQDFDSLLNLAKENSYPLEGIESAKRMYSKALEDLKSGRPGNGKILLLRCVQILQKIIHEPSSAPIPLLKYAIELQQSTLDITSETEKMPEEILPLIPILEASQKDPFDAGAAFAKSAFEWQKEQYQEKRDCQKKPWNTLMPFFHQGFQKAYESLKILSPESKGPVPLEYVVELQKKTIIYWKQALHSLEHDLTTEKTPMTQPEEPEFERLPTNMEQLIQTIIEQEQQDMSKSPPKKLKEQVEKPW